MSSGFQLPIDDDEEFKDDPNVSSPTKKEPEMETPKNKESNFDKNISAEVGGVKLE